LQARATLVPASNARAGSERWSAESPGLGYVRSDIILISRDDSAAQNARIYVPRIRTFRRTHHSPEPGSTTLYPPEMNSPHTPSNDTVRCRYRGMPSVVSKEAASPNGGASPPKLPRGAPQPQQDPARMFRFSCRQFKNCTGCNKQNPVTL